VDFKNKFDKVIFSHEDSLLENAYFSLIQFKNNKDEYMKYFQTQSDSSLNSEKNIRAIFYLEEDLKSREMAFFLTHQMRFLNYFSKESINNKIYRILRKNVELAIKHETHINDFCENFVKFEMPLASELSRVSKVIYYEMTQNWKQFAETSLLCLENKNADIRFTNNICWNFYLHVSDTSKLNKAENFLSKNLNNNPRVYDTYAALLYKNGKTNLAIKAAKEAISLAKKKDEDFSESTVLLEKIKGKK
jgi:tetratricopeptide (TPR) repeat protein